MNKKNTAAEAAAVSQISEELGSITAILTMALDAMDGDISAIGSPSEDGAAGLALCFAARMKETYLPAIYAARNMVYSLAEQESSKA